VKNKHDLKPKKISMVNKRIMLTLLLIGFIAMIEYGPPAIPLVEGPSPFNSGALGTSKFVQLLVSEGYNVIPVTNWNKVSNLLNIQQCNEVLIIIISPELSYNNSELLSIKNIMNSCNNVSFIIADEGLYGNQILSMLNSGTRIIASKRILEPTGDPYPYAELKTPSNHMYYLRLDKAAPLQVNDGEIMGIAENLPVSSYQIINKSRIYVIGDGSIFLNQVLNLPENVSLPYKNFALQLVSDLTNKQSIILVEASKYISTSNPQQLILSSGLNILNNPELFLLLLSRILHPRFWAPSLFNIINSYIKNLISSPLTRILIALLLVFFSYWFISRYIGKSMHDLKLEDTSEVDVIVDTQIRRTLLGKKIKVSKNDFIALYEVMDQVIMKTVGVRISEPDAIRMLITHGIEEKMAKKYVNDMNKLYMKITKRKFRPIVISWNKKITEMIKLSEKVLNTFGSTLIGEKGIEYKIRYGKFETTKEE
jgi:fumarate reductase subunit D